MRCNNRKMPDSTVCIVFHMTEAMDHLVWAEHSGKNAQLRAGHKQWRERDISTGILQR